MWCNVIRWEIRFICIILKAFPQPAELSICNTLRIIENLLFYIVGYRILSNPCHIYIISHLSLIPQQECSQHFQIYLNIFTSRVEQIALCVSGKLSSLQCQGVPRSLSAFNTTWTSEIRRRVNVDYCSLARENIHLTCGGKRVTHHAPLEAVPA